MPFLPIFFSVLIAIELIDTMKIYLKDNVVHSHHIILVGIIAISRKLITIDFSHGDAIINLSLAALIIALAIGYYFVKLADKNV